MSSWEERMAERHWTRQRERLGPHGDPLAPWREPGDPPDISPQILAARCLGIAYGDPGPRLPDRWCRDCWGDRYVWLGNAWGLQHVGGGMGDCSHGCHKGEMWLAAAADLVRGFFVVLIMTGVGLS